MDAMLQSLFVLIYIEIAALSALSYCAKKQMKTVTPEKMEPPTRKYMPPPPLQPRKIELNQKETLIKGGLRAGRLAYPTLDDIKSDWSEKEEKDKGKGEVSRSRPEEGKSGSKEKRTPTQSSEEASDTKKQEKQEGKKAEEKIDDEKRNTLPSVSVESLKSKDKKSEEKIEDGAKIIGCTQGSKSAEGRKSGEKSDEEKKDGRIPSAVPS